jgi:SAM-dependent methyltransferase
MSTGVLRRVLYVLIGGMVALVVLHFPWATDNPLSRQETTRLVKFYTNAYDRTPKDWVGSNYVAAAQAADEHFGTTEAVKEFVHQYGLSSAKALDIGSGRGQLQDVVTDYTGLDIAPTAGRFYHKRFVTGSATALPFPDNSFDTAWSIATLEHVPNPEQALAEMRRVVRKGGLLYMAVTWSVPTWAAEGYDVRPYSSLGLTGKLVKATIPLRSSLLYRSAYVLPIRFFRLLAPHPTRLRYVRLNPNYHAFWNDSDACNSIDRYEAVLWYRSRGDQCPSCKGAFDGIAQRHQGALIIRVEK